MHVGDIPASDTETTADPVALATDHQHPQHVQPLPANGKKQVFLAFKIKVTRAFAQLHLFGDLVHGGLLKALFEKYMLTGFNDVAAALFLFPFFSFFCAHRLNSLKEAGS